MEICLEACSLPRELAPHASTQGEINFAEFCRVFTAVDVLHLKHTLVAGVQGPDDIGGFDEDVHDEDEDATKRFIELGGGVLGAQVRACMRWVYL